MKAIEPAHAAPPFEAARTLSAKRVTGFVDIPVQEKVEDGKTSNVTTAGEDNDPLQDSFFWKDERGHTDTETDTSNNPIATADKGNSNVSNGNLDSDQDAAWALLPSMLSRSHSIAGSNILLIGTSDDEKANGEGDTYWLQRKIAETSDGGNIRIGFRLRTKENKDNSSFQQTRAAAMSWEVAPSSPEERTKSSCPFQIVAVKITPKFLLQDLKGEPNEKKQEKRQKTTDTSDEDTIDNYYHDNDKLSAELSALQMISKYGNNGNVITSYQIASDGKFVYTIMPYHKDGTLFDYIGRKYSLTTRGGGTVLKEATAQKIFQQIVRGLETLQKVGLCHRNLSLDTILLNGDTFFLNIANLDYALRIPQHNGSYHLIEAQPAVGRNLQFIAPEILNNKPFDGYAIDLWSAGIILFVMLFGIEALFTAPVIDDRKFKQICIDGNIKEVINAATDMHITTAEQDSSNNADNIVSEEVIDLLKNMLRADPKDRYDLLQVKNHSWFSKKLT